MATAETRKLDAIMFTDVVGFSRQMGANEARTLRLLEVHNQLMQQAVTEYHGHVIKTIGDAFLVEFPSVVYAVQCAQRVQELTGPDTVCISDMVYRDVAKKIDLGTVVSLGRPQLKNIAERFQVYALLPEP